MVCDNSAILREHGNRVLILILLEYGLRLWQLSSIHHEEWCLNPYSIGIWSATWCALYYQFNFNVLILILLEYGLRLLKSQIIDFQTLKTWKGLLLELISPKYVPFSPANIGILFIADCILAI